MMMMRHNGVSLHRTELYHTGIDPSIGNVHNVLVELIGTRLVNLPQSFTGEKKRRLEHDTLKPPLPDESVAAYQAILRRPPA